MPMLPLKLMKIATVQLSQSLPLGKVQDLNYQNKQRSVQKVKDGVHSIVAGRTGMGKTKLIKEIIRKMLTIYPYYNVYHIDTKKKGDFSSRDGTMIISEIAPDAFKTVGNRLVWQPTIDDKEQYSKFFLNILNAGLPAIVDIDESINMKFGNTIPRGLSLLLAQGRLPGINVLGGTQEIAQVPRQLLSQATHVYSFSLLNEYDEKTMLRYLHLRNQDGLGLKKHQFYHLDADTGNPARKYNSYQEVLPLIR